MTCLLERPDDDNTLVISRGEQASVRTPSVDNTTQFNHSGGTEFLIYLDRYRYCRYGSKFYKDLTATFSSHK